MGEVWRGILRLPSGRRRADLETWFAGPDGVQAAFAGRVLPFDQDAALTWARLMAEGERAGRPRSVLDTMIAAVALANDCVVATMNERDFQGVASFNPAASSAS